MSERVSYTTPGPKFFKDEAGDLFFQFTIDPRNVIGPRPATAKDQAEHAGAWQEFTAETGVGPLDCDAKDGPGGSLPAASADPDRFDGMGDDELRAAIKEKSGIAPHHKTGRARLLEAARALYAE